MLNKVQIIGRLGQDPELREVGSSQVANFSVATTNKYKDRNGDTQETTEWHRVSFWGRQAEVCADYMRKGQLVYIEGSLKTRKYEKDGETRSITSISGANFQFLDWPGDRDEASGQKRGSYKKPNNESRPTRQESKSNDYDEDIPF